jgi:hypothetical protein
LSLTEDVLVVGLGIVTLKYPLLALAISVVILLTMVLAARWVWRWLRRPPQVVTA